MSEVLGADDKLPRRDWVLLPLVVLLVTAAFLGAAEVSASLMFAERGRFTCGAPGATGVPHQIPNCVCHFKNAEGPDVEYRFNECGYRSTKPCGTKPPNTVRVVLIGTSITMGLYVPHDETYAARTQQALDRICSRPVEVQNMGALTDAGLSSQPEVVGEALELSPDVIVLTVVPFDLPEPPTATQHSNRDLGTALARIESAWYRLKLKMREIRFVFAAAHFMLSNEQMLYQMYLSNGPSRDVMSYPPTAAGERRYAEFATILERITARLNGSGVPLIVVAVPNRIEAAMVSNRSRVEGVDAGWFGRHISEIAVQHGALQLDVTPRFAASPHAERLFYPVDNHPTGGAHAIIAQALVARLTDGSIPQMATCRVTLP
jgi:hypothetical protein